MAGLRLDVAGPSLSKVIVAGEPEQSKLWQMMTGKGAAMMPPAGKLPEADLAVVREWIQSGAKWPERSSDFGRKCLLARRLVERGVRFVQLYSGTNLGDDWDDAQNDLLGSHNKMAKKSDQPVAGLLADLEGRGLLDSTLVVWSSEFGRTPLAEGANGRDHLPYGFSMWMAGAGIRGGRVLGATDEFGLRAVEDKKDVHDVHATIFRLLGLDHTQVTYRFQGRDQRLTDVHGEGEFTDWLTEKS